MIRIMSCCLAMSLALAGPIQADDDVAKAAGDKVEQLFDNEYVSFSSITLAPFEELPPHKGPNRVIYALSDYEVEYSEGDTTTTKQWKAGQAHWHKRGKHSLKILGETQARFLVIARKPKTPFESPPAAKGSGLAKAAPESAKRLLNNRHVRVTRFELAPGKKLLQHRGLNRIVYSLNSYSVKFTPKSGAPEVETRKEREVHWHDAEEYSVENCGDGPAKVLIVEFKR